MTDRPEQPPAEAELFAHAMRDEPRPPDQPRRWRWAPFAALVAVLVAGNATGWTLWYRSEAAKRERAAVRNVALRFSRNLVTFDYRTLDADVKRIQADSTGRFHTELETALGGGVGVFKDVLVEAQSQSSGKVHRIAVLSVEGSTANVFAQLDQTIRNKETPEPRTVPRTLDITLVKTDKGWKVDGVKAEEE